MPSSRAPSAGLKSLCARVANAFTTEKWLPAIIDHLEKNARLIVE
jgi:hypothetical protein